MKRKRMIPLFKIARKFRDYDEYPVLQADIDPQVHVSRNSIAQPFYLICEQDTVLVQLTGKSRIHFKNSNVAISASDLQIASTSRVERRRD